MLTISVRTLATSIAWVALTSSVGSAQDLSGYRQFQMGSSLATVARQAGLSGEPRVIHQRPVLIHELMWLPSRSLGSPAESSPVQKLVFTFYDDQLFRIAISYGGDRTEGLTVQDLVEAISATYGLPILPSTDISGTSLTSSDPDGRPAYAEHSRYTLSLRDRDSVVARWGDSEYSLLLVHSSYLSTFGMVLFAKRPDALARAATVEAIRLDELEAPAREIQRRERQTEEARIKEADARRVNKSTFRY